MNVLVWALLVFMTVPPGFDYAPSNAPLPSEGTPFERAVWLSLLGIGLLLVLSRQSLFRQLLRQVNRYFLVFIVLATASILWSIEPAVTLRRMIRVLTFVLDAMALAMVAWNLQRIQQVLRPFLTLYMIGSIWFAMSYPQLAIEQSTNFELHNSWHGLATQKNGLGSLASFSTLLWVHALLSKEKRLWAALPGLAVSAVCLFKSRSSTSIMATAFTCAFMLLLLKSPNSLRRSMPYLVGTFVVLLLIYSLAVLNLVPGSHLILSPIAALSGKDMTFSGRTAIWNIINEHIRLRPLLGSGYGAYWIELPGSPSLEMLGRLYFYPSESHNGYLDVINDLGVVGGLCLVGYLIVYIRQALDLFAVQRTQGTLYLAFIFQQFIANLSESRWFNVLTVEFVLMTLATICLARSLLDAAPARRTMRNAAPAPPGQRAWLRR